MQQMQAFLEHIQQLLTTNDFIRSHVIQPQDFTRKRKLTFQYTWWCMMAHTGSSLLSEVHLFPIKFENQIPLVSPQAFSKARNKISYTACEAIFKETIRYLLPSSVYKGYHLAAVDGSKLLTPDTKSMRKTLGTCGNHTFQRAGAGISLLYDPLSDFIINAKLVSVNTSERDTLMELLNEQPLEKTILLLDRGYPSRELFHFLNEKKIYYIMRMSNGASTPKYIRDSVLKDQIAADNKDANLTQRILRIPLSNHTEELLVSNLLEEAFTIEDFKYLYHLRWPVETKYDELKNKWILEKFTGSSIQSVYQDFYNLLIKANITAYFRMISRKDAPKSKGYPKKIGIQASIKFLQYYLPKLLCECNRMCMMETMCMTLRKMLIPIRTARTFPRKKKHTDRKYRHNLK